MAGEKNLLPQLRRPRDRETFGIPFVMESGMRKHFFSLILIKRLLVYAWILYEIIIRSNMYDLLLGMRRHTRHDKILKPPSCHNWPYGHWTQSLQDLPSLEGTKVTLSQYSTETT